MLLVAISRLVFTYLYKAPNGKEVMFMMHIRCPAIPAVISGNFSQIDISLISFLMFAVVTGAFSSPRLTFGKIIHALTSK